MLTATSAVKFVPAAAQELQIAYRHYALNSSAGVAKSPTLVVAHATGLCKEVYAPLLEQLKTVQGDAFALDSRNHGDSGTANLELLESGHATAESFLDNARDILALIDALKLTAKRPLIGMGHSVGAAGMLFAEIMRPNTFDAIVAIDPIISTVDLDKVAQGVAAPDGSATGLDVAHTVINRKATWKSRDEARAHLAGRGMYTGWCPQAMDAFLNYGLRDLEDGAGVTLKCTPKQEAHSFLSGAHYPYLIFQRLHEIRIPILFIGSEGSEFIPPKNIKEIAMQCQRQECVILPRLRHMMPHEDPKAVASAIDQFLRRFNSNAGVATAKM
ncbi:Alpha/Beta hydrolase protein [Thamnocephalis sphaerospora]|uniref:Alpha/Beta hydrolase protein n=1 Tax=Thamnocephalis sphaerospora TaxID=78915 RepID=A0A4P9XX63_9FUNG|nr:Alpha/Beta hydrolase protein [Thamnocephalis sphaerospora]|eukprot:RKP10946.1 Alpha/Beta hydrolase protein [Thamnocephalis sphaerospora]